MSVESDHLAIERQNVNLNSSSNNQLRNFSHPRVSFSPKKCWVCTSIFEMNQDEYETIQRYYFDLYSAEDPKNANKIKLISIMNKFILSICKCRKKLAHFECFQNYIDLKQNGNVSVDLFCSQCSYKYEFIYPLNSIKVSFFFQNLSYVLILNFKL